MPGERPASPPPRQLRLGLVVNPIAGLGGRVGLKGTDGPGTVARALALGATPRASQRAASALASMTARMGADGRRLVLLTGAAEMGEHAAAEAGLRALVVGRPPMGATTAEDTRQLVDTMVREGLDLLLFAGGDGTARDVRATSIGATPVLGIPAGVKVQSAVFAISPAAAGTLAAEFLGSLGGYGSPTTGANTVAEREVLDLDEDAYRRGDVSPRLYGYLRVPVARTVQARKSPTPVDEFAATAAVAAAVASRIGTGDRYILGPGTTVRAVAERLGVAKTLVGVDVVMGTAGGARLLVADATESDLLTAIEPGRTWVVVTPIGGQGFLFGRGNQQISAAVLTALGRARIVVVATPTKLAGLGGRPMLVDTGDAAVDRELSGMVRVVTGDGEVAVMRVEAA